MSEYKIYPKQFRNAKIPVEKNRCFFIMPFSNEFDIIYGEIKAVLSREKYICVRVDEVSGSTPIITKILTEILKAQFIIVDLTNCNPNVFYELGVAQTFKDAENIFLLKDQDSKVPFDITHLRYLEYDKNNMCLLTATLKNELLKNTYISNFYEALNVHGIINYVHDNQDEFIEILKSMLGSNIATITEILEGSCELDESDVEGIINNFRIKFKHSIGKYDSKTLKGLIDFYGELLLACDKYSFVGATLNSFVTDLFSDTNIADTDKISFKTDIFLKFACKDKQLNTTMPWIISYFKNSKSATVDLNRYKLESFLLTTKSPEVNKLICDAMTDSDAHVREHLADIIGEKNLIEANPILCRQLQCEENFYTASSIIEALGKLGDKDNLRYIITWLDKKELEIIETKHLFIFNHARIAIARLDNTYLKIYEEKYNQYLES